MLFFQQAISCDDFQRNASTSSPNVSHLPYCRTLCSSENLNGRSWPFCLSVTLLMIKSRVSKNTSEVPLSLMLTDSCTVQMTVVFYKSAYTPRKYGHTLAVPPTVFESKCTDKSASGRVTHQHALCRNFYEEISGASFLRLPKSMWVTAA